MCGMQVSFGGSRRPLVNTNGRHERNFFQKRLLPSLAAIGLTSASGFSVSGCTAVPASQAQGKEITKEITAVEASINKSRTLSELGVPGFTN